MSVNRNEARYRRCTCNAVLRFGPDIAWDTGKCSYCNQKEREMTAATVRDYDRWKKRNC